MNVREMSKLLARNEAEVYFILNKEKIISQLKTPQDAQKLHSVCHESLKQLVMKRWEELVQEALPSCTDSQKIKALYANSPGSMLFVIIQALAKM